MRAASKTATEFSGARMRSQAAAARPVNPPPMMAKSTWAGSLRGRGVKEIFHGVRPQGSNFGKRDMGLELDVWTRELTAKRTRARGNPLNFQLLTVNSLATSRVTEYSPSNFPACASAWP